LDRSKDNWMIRGETILFRLILIFVIALFISQLLLFKEGTRIYLSKVDRMEGEKITATMPLYADTPLQITEDTTVVKGYQNLLRKRKVIFIHIVNPSENLNIYMVVNGKRADGFTKGNCRITVYDGDYVEIDATALEQPVQFIINVPDNDLLSPADGLVVEGSKSILAIGKIKFKNE
jgi:hypothetical protein